MKHSRGLLFGVLGGGLVVVILLWRFLSPEGEERVRVVVERGEILQKVEASGQLESAHSIFIGCPTIPDTWNFTITALAPEGKWVRAGQPILAFDAKKLLETHDLERSQLDTARKELEKITLEEKEEIERLTLETRELEIAAGKAARKIEVRNEATEALEYEKLRLDAELARFKVEASRRRLETERRIQQLRIATAKNRIARHEQKVAQIEAAIRKMRVLAPRDGIVIHLATQGRRGGGKKPAVGDTVWFGQTILELPDLTRMQAAVVVAEPDAGLVQVGQRATLSLDALPNRTFSGKVTRLGTIFRAKSDEDPSVVFDAIIEIDNPDPEVLRPGMTVTASIETARREGVLRIPEAFLVMGKEGPFVWKSGTFGRTKPVMVQTGLRAGGYVEILAGLAEGDEIVLPNALGGGRSTERENGV
ncbi:MAG: efflux RND transporter periplasmic adaptor subunit [Deltaproteobacteria bacterium]|nr:MAG: efflux RND transporter periplasmic adaptor subunit [Deltaproteobacteria bacterium]